MSTSIKGIFQKIVTKVNSPVFRNILLVGSIAMMIKLVSFYKETVISSSFGLSTFLDSFFLAILIPNFINNIALNALQHLFIPNYITELNTTNQRASFQSFTLILITIIAFVLGFVVILISDILLEFLFPGHPASFYSLIRDQLYIVLPCLLFWAYSSFLSGLLEINNKYFISSISSIFTAIITIVFIFYLKDFFEHRVLAASLLAGSLVGFCYLLFFTLKFKFLELGRIKLNENTREMLKQYPPKITSAMLTGINPFVDQYFAAQLIAGSVAAINYGVKIPTFLVGILMLALGNVLLPYFSREVNTDLKKAYKKLFQILKGVFVATLVLSLIMIFLSEEIVEILFERKAFTSRDTITVSSLQKIALLYVPFYLCTLICVKFLTSINKNKFMAWVSLFNLFLNLIMNIMLVGKYGLYGLVMSTSIVYITCSFIYVYFTFRTYKTQIS